MTRRKLALLGFLAGGLALGSLGCSSAQGPSPAPATVRQVCFPSDVQPTCYFDVTLDLTRASHREVGRQYALAILQAKPDYEATIDYLLTLHVYVVKLIPRFQDLSFADFLRRARILHSNGLFNPDYADEIAGMQDVFTYDVDRLGDGRLSRNELLVFQFLSEVIRPISCSASAVTGDASATGSTLIGRNWDWISLASWGTGEVHALTTFRNGDRTVVNVGSLGMLNALTVFNPHRLVGAVVNATTGAYYPSDDALAARRSLFFDLREAFETHTTLDGVVDFLKSPARLYVYNHLMFVADPSTAGVVENQVNSISGAGPGNRSFRTDASPLNPQLPPGQGWDILGAFAAVNDFRLPGNDTVTSTQLHLDNTTRWTSFRNLYAGVPSGQRIDVETLKSITGYPGPGGDGIMTRGAIFTSELQTSTESPAYTTQQSIVMDLRTMDLWIHFVPPTFPWARPPPEPTYRKIANPIY